jgi:hypothetical protein
MVDFEWLVEGGTRPIPTLASSPFVGICEENGEKKAEFQ